MNARETVTPSSYGLCAALFAALLAAAPASAQTTTTETRTTGTVLREGAPETYVVQRGDTLWDISARFLSDPWLWPDIWTVNPEIANPHLIYPGDIIRLVWVDGQPRLVLDRAPSVDRLQPRIRESDTAEAIHVIPLEVIRPFLSRPQIIARDELDDAPYLLRAVDGRLMSGEGHRVYARGFADQGDNMNLNWTVVRKGQALTDPDNGDILGYEAEYIAEAVVDRLGDPVTVALISSRQEALAGDRLIDLTGSGLEAGLQPRAPRTEVDGRIVARLGGGMQIGQYHVVAINRGADDGLEPGMVLSMWQAGESIRDPHARGWFRRKVQLPDERTGELLVFRTWGRISYGLVMRATRDMNIGDIVRNP